MTKRKRERAENISPHNIHNSKYVTGRNKDQSTQRIIKKDNNNAETPPSYNIYQELTD